MVRTRIRRLVRTAKRRLLPGGSVVEDTVKGGVWSGLTTTLKQVMDLTRLLVLAALLSPAEFGLMGIALVCLAALRQFTKLGVKDALIHNPEEDVSDYLDTAWLMNVVRGLALFGVLFAAAPLLADFFGEPRATPIIRAIGVVPLLFGLQNPSIVYFEKDLQLHKRFVQQVSAATAGAVVAIAIALVSPSVWALVAGTVVRQVVLLIGSYALDPYRPSFDFDEELARELFGFGKWVTGLTILVFLNNQGDDLFVGWFLPATALGLYQFAYRISNMPATQVSHVISRVVFPAYSKVQDNDQLLRDGYVRALKLVATVSFPMTVGIVLTARPFIRGLLGTKWLPAVETIQILALWGLLRALGATSSPLFKAIGRPDYSTKVSFAKFVAAAILIYPATDRFGIEGTAAVIVLSSLFIAEPMVYYLVTRVIDVSGRDLLYLFAIPLTASLVMGGCVFAVSRSFPGGMPLVEFFALTGVGVAVYAGTFLALDGQFDYGIKPIARTIVDNLR